MTPASILAAAALFSALFAATPDERFREASESYRAREFAASAEGFRSLAEEGFESAAVFYNLGNAEYRRGNLGRAIAAYLRALDFAPREEDLDFNLRIVRQRRADRIEPASGPTFLRSLFFPHTRLTIGEETGLAAVLWLSGIFLLHAALFVRRAAVKNLGLVLAGLGVATAVSVAWRVRERDETPPAVVVAESTDVRTGPGEDFPVYFTLHDGTECRVLERGDGWTKVEIEGEKRGWLKDAEIERLPSLSG